MFIFPPRYYANCVSTTLTVLGLRNVESVYFFYSNPVYMEQISKSTPLLHFPLKPLQHCKSINQSHLHIVRNIADRSTEKADNKLVFAILFDICDPATEFSI